MELSLPVEDDCCDGRGGGTSPSLAPFLARLGRDDRLGWTAAGGAGHDTESLNVNMSSDRGSCHLSEVSSVSSRLNDAAAAAADDDCSSCAADDGSSSDKDDADDDEDDNGPEIRPLFLLERCLEEKLLEQQRKTDAVYTAGVSAAPADFTDQSSVQNDWQQQVQVETGTVKRASRNLFSFKSSDPATEGHGASDTNGVVTSMPLRRSGSRCDPDSLLCTGAIYDFNSGTDKPDRRPADSEASSVSAYDAAEDGQQAKPQQTMHRFDIGSQSLRISPSQTSAKNTSLVKDVAQTPLSFPMPGSKPNLADRSAVDGGLAVRDFKQTRSSADTQQANSANGSAGHKQHTLWPYSYSATVGDGKTPDGSRQSRSSTDFECCRSLSSEESKQQKGTHPVGALNDKSMSAERQTDTEPASAVNADNVDTASVVSDEAEKAAERARSVAMPAVEDGLSNSDVSDVDEAFSMFAGLKPPDPVPVDTSFGGSRSPLAAGAASSNVKNNPDSNTDDVSSFSVL